MIRLAAGFGLAALLTSPVSGYEPPFTHGDYEVKMTSGAEIDAAMRRIYSAAGDEDRKAALAAIKARADAGDAEAAFRLGRYWHLESPQRDYRLALSLYTQAQTQGHGWAINNIGLLYQGGHGVAHDDAKAREYFEQAAAKHNAFGFYNLALVNFHGRGVPRDTAAGLDWLEKCSALNLSVCLYEEAAVYYEGDFGVARDPAKALIFGTKASELGDRSAGWGVAKLYLLGEGTTEDAARGMTMMRTLSEQGYGRATGSLGELYADPKIRNVFFGGEFEGPSSVPDEFIGAVPANIGKAITYWQAAVQQGDCQSLIDLSSLYDRGLGLPLSYSMGAKYVAEAVRCNPTHSYYLWKLGKRLIDAKGMPRDCVMASQFFYDSIVFGNDDAAVDLGYLYDKGCDSILRDDRRALRIYLFGAKAGVALCQNNVGAMLKHGRGIGMPDIASGYAWMVLAARNGDALAAKNLEENGSLFSEEIRKQGLKHLEEIKPMIHKGWSDPSTLAQDDTSY